MQLNFEQQKNIKAIVYTSVICGSLLLLFIFLRWEKAAPIQDTPATSYMKVDFDPPPVEPPPVETPPIEPSTAKSNGVTGNGNENKGGGGNTNKEKVAGKTNTTTEPIPKHLYLPNKSTSAPFVTTDVFDYPVTISMPMLGKENKTGLGSNIKGTGGENGNGNGDGDGDGKGPGNDGSGGKKKINFNGDVKPAVIYAIIEVSANGVGKYIGVDKGGNANDATHVNEIKQKIKEIHFDNKGVVYKTKVKFDFKYQ
jgi:hypothetical protein